MGSGDSISLKVKPRASVNSLSHCGANDVLYSSDGSRIKTTTPIQLDDELIKMIVKAPKRRKQKSKPLFQYKPLSLWDSHFIVNAECNKEKNDKIKRKATFKTQSSFNSKAAKNYPPAVVTETRHSEPNHILLQADNTETNALSCKNLMTRISLQPLASRMTFVENHKSQTNCELLGVNINKAPSKQSEVESVKSLGNYMKRLRRASVCEKDLIHTKLKEMPPFNPKRLAHISTQRRSSLLREDAVINSIAKLKSAIEDNKDLPKIKRMNAFIDEEEIKKSNTIPENGEGTKNAENIAVMLREQYKKKKQKNNIKPEGKFTSKAEKKRLWVGANGKFDAARLKSWHSEMNNIV